MLQTGVGVKTGAKVDKFKEMKLTKERLNFVNCPGIKESPVSIECKVKEIKELRKPSYVYSRSNGNKCRRKIYRRKWSI